MDIISLARQLLSWNFIDQLSKNIWEEKEPTKKATWSIMDLILWALAKNTSTPEGAAQLDKALEEDHDGSLLDNLSDYLSGKKPEWVKDTTLNAKWILDHILWSKKEPSEELISKQTGMSKASIGKLLLQLAPIWLAMLGKVKKETWAWANEMSQMIQETAEKEKKQSWFMGMVQDFFDKNDDRSVIDDIVWMAKKKFFG